MESVALALGFEQILPSAARTGNKPSIAPTATQANDRTQKPSSEPTVDLLPDRMATRLNGTDDHAADVLRAKSPAFDRMGSRVAGRAGSGQSV